MTIAQSTQIQAYQLRKGGTRARLAILQMIAAESNDPKYPPSMQKADWRAARNWRINTYESAYAFLSQGKQGKTPIWYTHAGEEFRDERDAHSIVRNLPHGWFTDTESQETAIGIVARLPHGRFIAGYRWTDNGERVYFPEIFTDDNEAARAADSHAERFADDAREHNERFQEMCLAELDSEEKTKELEKAIALRHRAKFGGKPRVRDAIAKLRAAREELADAKREYEGAAK